MLRSQRWGCRAMDYREIDLAVCICRDNCYGLRALPFAQSLRNHAVAVAAKRRTFLAVCDSNAGTCVIACLLHVCTHTQQSSPNTHTADVALLPGSTFAGHATGRPQAPRVAGSDWRMVDLRPPKSPARRGVRSVAAGLRTATKKPPPAPSPTSQVAVARLV